MVSTPPRVASLYKSYKRPLLLCALLLTLVGCTGPLRQHDIFWPPPPERRRIEFVKAFSTVSDVEPESIRERIVRILFGPAPKVSLAKPYAVHADQEGRVFVADSGWRKVLVFDFPRKRFFMLGVDGPGLLTQPHGVTTDSSGRIYVTDSRQKRVVVYDHDGGFLSSIGDRTRLEQPVGVAINEKLGRIYVVDTRKHAVLVFGLTGEFLSEFGGRGIEDGKFNFPTHIAIDREGKLAIVDTFNFRVQTFDPEGVFLSKFGSVGTGFGQFSRPKGIGIDSEGHIYVVDAAFNNVQIFDQQGRLLLFFGEFGDQLGQFWLPAGLHIDNNNLIYVADQYNRRINVFRYLPEEGQKKTAGRQGEPEKQGSP